MCYPAPGSNVTIKCLGSFQCYPAPGSDITNQYLSSFFYSDPGSDELMHFFGKIQVCVHFILSIKLLLCCISFNFMQSNIQVRGVNHLNECRSRRSYRVMKKTHALHKINYFIHKDTE